MRRAVVLGGSVAGLLAARVLSDHADDVVIVEPDAPGPYGTAGEPPGAVPVRPGVPQGGQLHVLLPMGRAQLDRWFPGFSGELLADGAVRCPGAHNADYADGRRLPALPGADLIGSTRPFLEFRLRARVLAADNVTVAHGRADGLRFGAGGRQRGVTGAYWRPAGAADRECLGADLVVDATGRASRLGVWLEQAGWRAPALDRMRIDLGYATALLRADERTPPPGTVTALAGPPRPGAPQRDSVLLAPVEDGRRMLVLAGYAAARPTGDPAAFRARCRAIPVAAVRAAADAEPLAPIAPHRVPDSRRRDFLGLDRFPAGLIAVGDAVAAFNPVYGQGMTSAALHASCLSGYLRSGGTFDRPARGFFERLRVVVDAAWRTCALGDLARPHVDGPYPVGHRAARRYADLLTRASAADPELGHRLRRVAQLSAHPRLLTRPGTVWRAAGALFPA